MHHVRGLVALFVAALSLASLGSVVASCSSSSAGDACQASCDKVDGCGLKADGFTCSGDCGESGCAYCINAKSCDDLRSGQCSTVCVGVNFIAKPK